MEKNSRIYVAGHRGLVGSAILRELQTDGYKNLITRTRAELNLQDPAAVVAFFTKEKPEYVFDAAARVGGIFANNTYPAEFISENLAIQNNIIPNCYTGGVKKLLFLGSSCVYPRVCPQPIKEEYLLTSELEPTNRAYAIAKIAGVIECQSYNREYGTNFVSVMPTNIYGLNDNFDPKTSHMLAALVRKFYEAKEEGKDTVTLWGTGAPRRELLWVDDLADACVFIMNHEKTPDLINIGTGLDASIKDIAEMIKKISGFTGTIMWDTAKPDGMPQKLLDVSRLQALGWRHTVDLGKGVNMVYDYFAKNPSVREGKTKQL